MREPRGGCYPLKVIVYHGMWDVIEYCGRTLRRAVDKPSGWTAYLESILVNRQSKGATEKMSEVTMGSDELVGLVWL
jgi:hypothetical protein